MIPQDVARHVTSALQEIFGELLGVLPTVIALQSAFLELGADSLLLMRASQAISDRLGVKVPFRDLLAKHTNIELLSAFVVVQGGAPTQPSPGSTEAPAVMAIGQAVQECQPVREEQEAPHVVAPDYAGGTAGAGGAVIGSDIPSVLRTQLEVMTRQLELLHQGRFPTRSRPAQLQATASQPEPEPAPRRQSEPVAAPEAAVFIPYAPIRPRDAGGMTGSAREHVERLTAELQERTAGSKRLAGRYRPVHADNRAAAGFQLAWKEIVYPIVADRASGSRFHDVDGNEYIDIIMDYGVNLFGHSPPFITSAIAEQLPRGMPIGPYSGLAGPTAAMVRELTGVDRVAFVNSGTEAVMAALRVARTKVPICNRVERAWADYACRVDGRLGRAGWGVSGAGFMITRSVVVGAAVSFLPRDSCPRDYPGKGPSPEISPRPARQPSATSPATHRTTETLRPGHDDVP